MAKSIAQRAVAAQAAPVVSLGDKQFVVAKQVVIPQLKQKTGETVYITINEPIHDGDEIKDATGKLGRARLCEVTNLTDGKLYVYLTNAIFESALTKGYPDGSYVGRSFAIMKGDVVEGKRYKSLQVLEIQEK